ncbi:MAG: UDP-2,3-diacylglucosamine diphosphatase LpxI [Devosia sp.]
MARRVTLVAGGGDLVPHVANAIRERGDTLQVVDLVGRDEAIAADQFMRQSLSDAVALLAGIKAFGPSHMVLAGGVHITDTDRRGLAKAFGLAGKLAGGLGDIGLAGMILLYGKAQGWKLVGAHEVAPELLAPLGRIAGPAIQAELNAVAERAMKAAKAIGAIDLGQSIVVSGSRPIAAEDAGGTDGLLQRVAQLRAAGLVGEKHGPLVLAKARKPKQPSFVDLPAIGADTVTRAAEAGISVIAVEAGASLLLDRAGIEREAAARGVTIVGLRHG